MTQRAFIVSSDTPEISTVNRLMREEGYTLVTACPMPSSPGVSGSGVPGHYSVSPSPISPHCFVVLQAPLSAPNLSTNAR